MDYLTNKD